jgi:error-prone DNA polymerase
MLSILPAYAELHCISNFTFLRGASHPEELVDRARALEYTSIALTDECSLAGVVRAHEAAKRAGLHLIIGSEIGLSDTQPIKLVLLCQTRAGYGNLGELITLGRRRAAKGSYQLGTADLDGRTTEQAHLRGLPECIAILLPRQGEPPEKTSSDAIWLREAFGSRAWIGVELLHRLDDHDHLERMAGISRATNVPLVAAGNVHMHVRSRKPLQDTLTAIRLGKSVDTCGFALMPNAEAHLRSRTRLDAIYPRALLDATLDIAAQCSFSLDELRYEYPQELVPLGHTARSWLRVLTMRGARKRYPMRMPGHVGHLLRRELRLIAELQYEKFFLTVEDIVRFARGKGILCQGRGSAANSAVCYCLGITEVNPDEGNLLFERFISRARNEPPDIDVDFEHQRREEVIQYLYEKYGRHRTALTAVVVRYRPRSAVRDVGKALGIDNHLIEQVSKSHQWWDGKQVRAEQLAECGVQPDSPIARLWAELTDALIGFPRHLSQHVGGFVIASDKLARMVPIENATMPGRCVIEWDKDDLDALKLLKVDVLALGMLSAIRRSLEGITAKQQRPGATDDAPFCMQDIPASDAPTWSMIQRADTVGVFQIESRAQMSMLPRLKPECFYDLVIEVAIVRPGPIQGGMVHPYLRRKQGLETAEYPKDELRAALERTLGVPIFQEQVMQIAMIAAEFTADEADDLRRSMAAWKRKGGLHKFHDKLVGTMIRRGYTEAFAEAIFKQTEGFGEYGFPESHAASFAKLVWISCWIKCHHPDAFLVALLNSQPMGFYGPSQLVQDAQRHGVEVLPVDVLHSQWETTLVLDAATDSSKRFPVRLGMHMINGMREATAQRIVETIASGVFPSPDITGVADLAHACKLDQHDLQVLANANALGSLAGHRRQARWATAGIAQSTPLLANADAKERSLDLPAPREGQDIIDDYKHLSMSLGRHPMALLRTKLAAMRMQTAADLRSANTGRPTRACGLVIGRQRPGTAKGTVFVTLEDETGPINVIVWPSLVEVQRKELLSASLLAVYGIWQREGEVRHLVAKRLVDLSHMLGDLVVASRNFH